jgi:hypothetical protein
VLQRIEQLVFDLDRAAEQTGDDGLYKLRVILGHALDDEKLRGRLYQVVESERAKARADRTGAPAPKGKAGGAAPQARQLADLVERWGTESAKLDETARLFLGALLGGSFDLLRNRCPLAPKWSPEWDTDHDHALDNVREAMHRQSDPNDNRHRLDEELLVIAGMEALGAKREPTRGLFKTRSKSD